MTRLEIFKAGTHQPMRGEPISFTEAQLRASAVAYDPARSKAPIVIGHPALDAPAFGWVEALDASDGTLAAYVADVEPSFAEAVREGRYRNVSASFYAPTAPSNPRPGVFYLKHVGFLGAAAPAVKGLKTVSFAGEEADTLEFAGAAVPANLALPEQLAGSLTWLREMRRKEADLDRREVAEFAERMVREARVPAGLRDQLVAVLTAIPKDGEVSFAEAGEPVRVSSREALQRLLAKLPPAVSFGEIAKSGDALPEHLAMTLPAHLHVDAESARAAIEAEALAKSKGISFAEAVRQLERRA